LTVVEEDQAKNEMMIGLKYGKKNASEQISKQTKRKKKEQQQQKHTSKSVEDTFFYSIVCFFLPHTYFSYESNCPSFMVLRQNFFFFYCQNIYVTQCMHTYYQKKKMRVPHENADG